MFHFQSLLFLIQESQGWRVWWSVAGTSKLQHGNGLIRSKYLGLIAQYAVANLRWKKWVKDLSEQISSWNTLRDARYCGVNLYDI